MEDSHIAEPDLGDGNSLFAVFDGHGGAEVAKFCRKHFKKELMKHDSYTGIKVKLDYKKALEETFLKMDRILLSDKGKIELKGLMDRRLQGKPNPITGYHSDFQ